MCSDISASASALDSISKCTKLHDSEPRGRKFELSCHGRDSVKRLKNQSKYFSSFFATARLLAQHLGALWMLEKIFSEIFLSFVFGFIFSRAPHPVKASLYLRYYEILSSKHHLCYKNSRTILFRAAFSIKRALLCYNSVAIIHKVQMGWKYFDEIKLLTQ